MRAAAAQRDLTRGAERVVVELVTGRWVVESRLEGVLVLGVVPGLLDLLAGGLLDVVGEHHRRQEGAQPVEGTQGSGAAGSRDAVGVDAGVRGVDLATVACGEGVRAALTDRQMPLAVAAVGRPHDDARLVAVEQQSRCRDAAARCTSAW